MLLQLDIWSRDIKTDFRLEDLEQLSRIRIMTLINIFILDMFDLIHLHLLIQNIDFGENVTIFGVDNSSSTHVNNKKKWIR